MPKFPVSPYWSENPTIPIYLDPGPELESSPPPPKGADEHICPACETSSRDQPIHCISKSPAPPSYSSKPPSYHSSIGAAPSSRHLAVPTLQIQTQQRWPKPQAPLPAFQFDPEGRPHVRFRRNAFSPLSPRATTEEDIDWDTKSSFGLGIQEAPFRPDISPVTPGTVEKAEEGRSRTMGGESNFAQRIEQKLWKYSASGNVVKRWLLEIISWALSAICMAGIVIVLCVYKDKRIPNWPLGLTLNAYISVLAKIASAALLLPVSEALGQLKWSWFNKENTKKMWDFEIFDNASRGPWGAILLLVRTKGKSLAALGAAVTVFALAMDPFFQQVVEYPEQWRVQTGEGTIPRATGYAPYGAGEDYRRDSGQYIVPDSTIAGLAGKFFYDNGTEPMFFGKGVRAEIPLLCPNSNCTWPQYETLAVCNKCVNVSDLLEFKCLNKSLDWVQAPDADPITGENTFPNGTSCGWWLMVDDPLLMTGYTVDRGTNHSGEVLLMRAQPVYDLFTRNPLPGYTAQLNYTRNPLAHAIIVSGESLPRIQRNGTPIAHECLVSWCIQEMMSEYSEGGYTEIVKSTFFNSTLGSDPWVTREVFDERGVSLGTDYVYNENVTLISPNGITYEVGNYTQVMTLSLFDDPFPSMYTLVNSTDQSDAMLRYKQYVTINPWSRNVTHNPFMFANISTHMDRMATALTNSMRGYPDHTEMMTGPSFDKESIVDVRWAWMTLPLSLLGITFFFLVATIIRSSIEQDHIGVYKTSAIATLLYGLPDDMQKKIKSASAEGTPRANAKETRVKWVPRAGWRFSGHTNITSSPSSAKSRVSPPTEWK